MSKVMPTYVKLSYHQLVKQRLLYENLGQWVKNCCQQWNEKYISHTFHELYTSASDGMISDKL
jgi:hypothetical protein